MTIEKIRIEKSGRVSWKNFQHCPAHPGHFLSTMRVERNEVRVESTTFYAVVASARLQEWMAEMVATARANQEFRFLLVDDPPQDVHDELVRLIGEAESRYAHEIAEAARDSGHPWEH